MQIGIECPNRGREWASWEEGGEMQFIPVDEIEGESTEVMQDQQWTTVAEGGESGIIDDSRILISGFWVKVWTYKMTVDYNIWL